MLKVHSFGVHLPPSGRSARNKARSGSVFLRLCSFPSMAPALDSEPPTKLRPTGSYLRGASSRKPLEMPAHMILHEGRDEEEAVIVALLHPQSQRESCFFASVGE